MIDFVVGLPGAGKTFLAVRVIVRELRSSSRCVVTNLPLDLPRLQEFLSTMGWVGCVGDRVRLLTPEEACEFWNFRGRALWNYDDRVEIGWLTGEHRVVEEGKGKGNIVLDASIFSGQGVLYVLDEAHTLFPARQWQRTGPACLVALSQHRKLGDDVLLISQHPNQVDKQLRMLIQTWSYCTNLTQRAILGIRMPGNFLVSDYPEMLTGGINKPPRLAVHHIRPDPKGIMSCYRTMEGSGLVGGPVSQDSMRKKRGLSPWVWVFAFFAIPFAIWGLMKGGNKGLTKFLGGTKPASSLGLRPAESMPGVGPAAVQPSLVATNFVLPVDLPAPLNLVYPVGVGRMGAKVTVYMSDGDVILPGDPAILGLTGDSVHLRGRGWLKIGKSLHRTNSLGATSEGMQPVAR